MRTATLFESHQPVEEYLRIADVASGEPLVSRLTLKAVDTFMMRQLAACYPLGFTVIDLASEPTSAASTVFWSSQVSVRMVMAPKPKRASSVSENLVARALLEQGYSTDRLSFCDESTISAELQGKTSCVSPPLIMVAFSEDETDDISVRMESLLEQRPDAVVLVAPLGASGSCPILKAAINACPEQSQHQFTLLREISPFMAGCQLGLIYRKKNQHIPEILDRIKMMFQGNFDYLSLVAANVDLQVSNKQLEQKVEVLQADLSVAHQRATATHASLGGLVNTMVWKIKCLLRLQS